MKKLFKAIGIALCLVGLTSCEKEIKPTEEESPLYADFNFDYNDFDYSSMSLSEELDSNIKEDSQNKMENLKDNYESLVFSTKEFYTHYSIEDVLITISSIYTRFAFDFKTNNFFYYYKEEYSTVLNEKVVCEEESRGILENDVYVITSKISATNCPFWDRQMGEKILNGEIKIYTKIPQAKIESMFNNFMSENVFNLNSELFDNENVKYLLSGQDIFVRDNRHGYYYFKDGLYKGNTNRSLGNIDSEVKYYNKPLIDSNYDLTGYKKYECFNNDIGGFTILEPFLDDFETKDIPEALFDFTIIESISEFPIPIDWQIYVQTDDSEGEPMVVQKDVQTDDSEDEPTEVQIDGQTDDSEDDQAEEVIGEPRGNSIYLFDDVEDEEVLNKEDYFNVYQENIQNLADKFAQIEINYYRTINRQKSVSEKYIYDLKTGNIYYKFQEGSILSLNNQTVEATAIKTDRGYLIYVTFDLEDFSFDYYLRNDYESEPILRKVTANKTICLAIEEETFNLNKLLNEISNNLSISNLNIQDEQIDGKELTCTIDDYNYEFNSGLLVRISDRSRNYTIDYYTNPDFVFFVNDEDSIDINYPYFDDLPFIITPEQIFDNERISYHYGEFLNAYFDCVGF